ncbi:hypothetical protein ACJ72_06972 [Emergomyces africanus]|uniref:EKC/KEOPS complex subunit BUD32 n=1 Tax=Emergomyces africanus TaxID=1955775 RepID=A0A1B7NQ13_9EURO|nr:hypothetical protein ACJ72_06972 [Emergomyces africanus]
MSELSHGEIAIILKYPLSDSLDRGRDLLREAEQPRITPYDGAVDSWDNTDKRAVIRLLSILQAEEAADNLHSRAFSQNVASDLADLFKSLQQGRFNYDDYRPLMLLVIQHAPDIEIWKAVFSVITGFSRTTPPLSIPPSFDGTPFRSTSSSQRGSEQTRLLEEERLFEEIEHCTHRDVEGFFEKYFEGKDWNTRADDAACRALGFGAESGWPSFPDLPTEKDALDWWFGFQDEFLSDSRSIYFTTASKSDLTGSDTERQIDLLLRDRNASDNNWKDIRVIGKLKRPEDKIRSKAALLQMARYVREVFKAQPTRRFVHAFAVCGMKMEMWIWDRSGPFSSGSFNVNEDPKRFFRMILGYAMMTDEELGIDIIITQDDSGGKTITVKSVNGEEMVVQLNPKPLSYQSAIVCRGTTCFLADVEGKAQCVAKFSWTSDKRASEKDLLKLAQERGVKGVAEVVAFREITDIATLRDGLSFKKRHVFKSTSRKSSFHPSHSNDSRSRSMARLHPSTSDKQTSRKRRSPDKGTQLSKRSHSSSQLSKNDPQETELPFTVQSMHPPSLFDKNSKEQGPHDIRILCCLVISPAGRPVYKYRSLVELLMALRDAIRAHRSLYLVGNILHRDISENNIIITDPKNANGNFGMLIDLDLAKEIGSGRTGARHQTGTMEFMAIEVLRAVDHTYRHDLESFFYVLIWQCARHGWERFNRSKEKPEDSLLNEWYTGSYAKIAGRKKGHMDANDFEYLLWEFPSELECAKSLCRKLRRILFPIHQDALFTGTPVKPERLYEPIIQAFDQTIEGIKAPPDG